MCSSISSARDREATQTFFVSFSGDLKTSSETKFESKAIAIQQMTSIENGHMLVLGNDRERIGVSRTWLGRITPQGKILWEKTYKKPSHKAHQRVVDFAKGDGDGIYIAGESRLEDDPFKTHITLIGATLEAP